MPYEIFCLRLRSEIASLVEEEARVNHDTIEQTIVNVLTAWYEFHGPIAEQEER